MPQKQHNTAATEGRKSLKCVKKIIKNVFKMYRIKREFWGIQKEVYDTYEEFSKDTQVIKKEAK